MVPMMRIKAVLRDNEILNSEAGSKERIIAVAMKNLDRIISQTSLLKVMGLESDQRVKMLEELASTELHIWLGKEAQQDIIFIVKDKIPEEFENTGYQWQ